MRYALFATLAFLISFAAPAWAQERVTLGVGRLFTNDALGDGQDRWRTGSYVASWVRGIDGTVSLPENFGEVIEYRFASRILAPDDLVTPAPGDRRYAGIFSLGVYSHFAPGDWEVSTGGELVMTGPFTGIDAFQTGVHNTLGMAPPSAATRAAQFPNALYPSLSIEAARPVSFDLGQTGGMVLRPFVQMRAGDETYARLGADILFGPNFTSGVLARDETTGILYQTMGKATDPGLSFLLGGDTAKVVQSVWLPASGGYTLTPFRHRLRAGVNVQGDVGGMFYGVSWLGEEFTAQPEGQLVGALQFRLRF